MSQQGLKIIIPDQKFAITCSGLRSNTRHYFTFNDADRSVACRQENKALGDPLITNASGQIKFDFHFEFKDGQRTLDGGGIDDGYFELHQQIAKYLSAPKWNAPALRGGRATFTTPTLFFNVKVASIDGESFCTGQIGTKWNFENLNINGSGSTSSSDWQWQMTNAFLEGGQEAVDRWQTAYQSSQVNGA